MEKKLIDYDGFEAYSKSVRKKYADKVDKVVGKQLSTNDYTNEDKKKVDAIPDNPKYTDTVPDLSGYATKNELYNKVNKWDISNEIDGNSTDKAFSQQAVNYMVGGLRTQLMNYAQDLDEKADTKDIPKKLSQLENDKTFKTAAEIRAMIDNSTKLKKEVVTSLPTTGKDDVIYLVKDEKGKDNNNYLEYLWLNGKYELIGSTQVDLSGYMTKEEFQTWDDTNTMDMQEFGTEMATKLEKKIDKSQMASSISSPSNNQVLTTLGAKSQFDMLKSQLDNLDNVLTKELEKTLKKTDIQEFTQQELEEAFK